jgi:hypothetical protein
MYVPHGFNMEDIIYGTYVYSYKYYDSKAKEFVEDKWGSIRTYEDRKKAIGVNVITREDHRARFGLFDSHFFFPPAHTD